MTWTPTSKRKFSIGRGPLTFEPGQVRRIFNDQILVGFAGATADALNLSERLEKKLERYNGNLTRAAVELARDWTL